MKLIANYNAILNDTIEHSSEYYSDAVFTGLNGETYKINSKEDALYVAWMQIIANCPLGLELWMRVSTNYKQLQTIYYQRKNHRLKEWHIFCSFFEHLPYFQELILGQEYDKNFNYIVIDE